MLRKFQGISPKIDEKAHVFESADVIGMVEMKEYASVWPNCTVRGDVNRIEIGRYRSAAIPTFRTTAASMWQTGTPASSAIL